ncbi:TPA: prolipoprotein diacylglyceryl transferase, partial [Patescibacteria group bacterium]|nr:prolipoprotein diacylglyceryl transferase [Patescibacteria group bacterium]
WYGLLLASGIAAGSWLMARLSSRWSITQDQALDMIIWMLIGGLLGARLLFVVLKLPLYLADPIEILLIGRGGLSIHGAILGGAIGLWWYAKNHKLNFWHLADLAVPGVALGQAIGRWGNFFNQEAFGGPTELPWKMFVAPGYRPLQFLQEPYYHPTFLYESLLNLLVLTLILRVDVNPGQSGRRLAWYLVLYSSVRFGVEFFRVDSDTLGFLTIAQWASLAIVLIGAYWLNRKTHA